MTSRSVVVVVECADPQSQAGFWSRVLDRDVAERNPAEYLVRDPAGTASPCAS